MLTALPSDQNHSFVLMGVAGCGKSTIGAHLAQRLSAQYLDGDNFHPQSNIDKMSNGTALTDEDRWPWLEIVGKKLSQPNGFIFIGCSALKKSYRDFITEKAGEPVLFIHLAGSKELITERMSAREGHFMPTELLNSQFATLEIPKPDEFAIQSDISKDLDTIVLDIIDQISQKILT